MTSLPVAMLGGTATVVGLLATTGIPSASSGGGGLRAFAPLLALPPTLMYVAAFGRTGGKHWLFAPLWPVAKAVSWYLNKAFVTGRNRTMVDRMVDIFEQNDAVETLLVVVGNDHVPGQQKLLQDEHRFALVDAP